VAQGDARCDGTFAYRFSGGAQATPRDLDMIPALPASPLALVTIAVLGWLAAHVVLRAIAARGVLDVPNGRSSHSAPTPRAGGIAFVAVGTLALVAVALQSGALAPLAIAVVGAAIAWLGWRDDVDHAPAHIRLAAHLAAGALLLVLLWPFGALGIGWLWLLVLLPVTVVALAWMVSVVNFMDGIDGLVTSIAIVVAAGAALVLAGGPAAAPATASALVAASLVGFLALNWPPARIFMGDVGSGWIGIVLAGLAVWSARDAGWAGLWPWIILGGTLVTDATICLVRRILTGQRFTEPHRSHAYQNLARQIGSNRIGSHRQVTIAYVAVTLIWLLPLAIIAAARPHSGALLAVVAYLPLIEIALRLKSGVPGVAEPADCSS